MFITFEGIGGAGKTTQTAALAQTLLQEGREVVATREPGGTPLGEHLRETLLKGNDLSPWAEAGLFVAARAQLVNKVIHPALARDAHVVCDRYIDSSLAYQGMARGLGLEPVLDVNLRATRGLLPDRTFLLVLDVNEAIRRRTKNDRIEHRDREFLLKVDAAYHELAAAFPQRITSLDGSRPPEEIAKEVRDRIQGLS